MVTHASRGNSAFVEFQGQEVLSLQDVLRCSIRESIRWRHPKTYALQANSFGRTYKNQKFFLVHEWHVSQETHLIISRLLREFLWGDLRVKVVPERTTTYCAWGVPWQVPSSDSSRILCADVLSWVQTSRTPKIVVGLLAPSQRYSTIEEEEACRLWPEKKWLLEEVKKGIVVVPKRKL